MKFQGRRVAVIGDIRGSEIWKHIVVNELRKDKDTCFVFLGNYFDSKDHTEEQQLANYLDILHFKTVRHTSVCLLLGNHDIQYLKSATHFCPEYNPDLAPALTSVLDFSMKRGMVQMCAEVENMGTKFLISHAGISMNWLDENSISPHYINEGVNKLFSRRPDKFNYVNNKIKTQPPTWLHPRALDETRVKNYTHVVGHTWGKTVRYKPFVVSGSALPYEFYFIGKSGNGYTISLKSYN